MPTRPLASPVLSSRAWRTAASAARRSSVVSSRRTERRVQRPRGLMREIALDGEDVLDRELLVAGLLHSLGEEAVVLRRAAGDERQHVDRTGVLVRLRGRCATTRGYPASSGKIYSSIPKLPSRNRRSAPRRTYRRFGSFSRPSRPRGESAHSITPQMTAQEQIPSKTTLLYSNLRPPRLPRLMTSSGDTDSHTASRLKARRSCGEQNASSWRARRVTTGRNLLHARNPAQGFCGESPYKEAPRREWGFSLRLSIWGSSRVAALWERPWPAAPKPPSPTLLLPHAATG